MTFSAHYPAESTLPSFPMRIAGLPCLLLLVLGAGPPAAQQSAPIVEKTAHFTIEAEGEGELLAAEAQELSVVLEQAWTAYVDVPEEFPAADPWLASSASCCLCRQFLQRGIPATS